MHQRAFSNEVTYLPVGGQFKYRKSGEAHAFDGQVIHAMQHACNTGSTIVGKNMCLWSVGRDKSKFKDLLDFTQKNNRSR